MRPHLQNNDNGHDNGNDKNDYNHYHKKVYKNNNPMSGLLYIRRDPAVVCE